MQRAQSLLEILVVADTEYFLSIRDELVRRLQQKFPQAVSVEVVQVDHIDADPSGKIRTLISEVG